MTTTTTSPTKKTPLSSILPPLIFGTATFNYQYNTDPYALNPTSLVAQALTFGIRAFDTSPYYGPSEEILGAALDTPFVTSNFPREEFFLITKCGREAGNIFDYSPSWIRKSVSRSLQRLKTKYVDLVYCHDVEFVSDAEVLSAVRELRRIRDEEGTVKYIGISGYPLEVLCRLARKILHETGEPLDAVMSYGNFTLQNQLLATRGVQALRSAGVDVVPNASPLAMGLLRREGVPVGSMGNWHPANDALRSAVRRASDFCDRHDERLEVVAIRFALESWLTLGAEVGSRGDPASGVQWQRESNSQVGGKRLGVSVMGVSKASELEKTMQVWRSILDGLENGQETARLAGRWKRDHEWSLNRRDAVRILADGIMEHLDEWADFTWESPGPGVVKNRNTGVGMDVGEEEEEKEGLRPTGDWARLTPAASPQPEERLGSVVEDVELPVR